MEILIELLSRTCKLVRGNCITSACHLDKTRPLDVIMPRSALYEVVKASF